MTEISGSRYGKGNGLSMRVLAGLLVVAAIVVIGHLLPGLDNSGINREIRNSLHIIGFAFVAAVIFENQPAPGFKAAILTLIVVLTLGGIAEFMQGFAGKDFDANDLVRDLVGASLYLLARLSWKWSLAPTLSGKHRIALRTVSLLPGALIFVPLVYWSVAHASLTSRYPVVLDFAGRWDSRLYFPINAEIGPVTSGQFPPKFAGATVRIELLRKNWSGIRIEVVEPDWSDYQYLTLLAASASEDKIRINVELSDGTHPGLRSQHLIGGDTVGSDPKRLKIPLAGIRDVAGRPELDNANIRQIYIIGRNQGAGPGLLLADIRLE